MTATLSPVMTTPVIYTADDDVCTTTFSPVRETTTGVRPTIRRNLINSRNRLVGIDDCLTKLIRGEDVATKKLELHADSDNC